MYLGYSSALNIKSGFYLAVGLIPLPEKKTPVVLEYQMYLGYSSALNIKSGFYLAVGLIPLPEKKTPVVLEYQMYLGYSSALNIKSGFYLAVGLIPLPEKKTPVVLIAALKFILKQNSDPGKLFSPVHHRLIPARYLLLKFCLRKAGMHDR